MSDEGNDIAKVTVFVDGEGREVREYETVFAPHPEKFCIGVAVARLEQRDQTGRSVGNQEVTFRFRFPEGIGVKPAFGMFDKLAKEAVDKFVAERKEEAANNRLIVPGHIKPRL